LYWGTFGQPSFETLTVSVRLDAVLIGIESPEMIRVAAHTDMAGVVYLVAIRDGTMVGTVDEPMEHLNDAIGPLLPEVPIMVHPVGQAYEAPCF
jgi:hypothetical protein